jgi:hypothetical protein
MTILYAMTALLPFVAIGAFIQVRYCRRQRAHLPTSEWLEGMRKLDTGEIVRAVDGQRLTYERLTA